MCVRTAGFDFISGWISSTFTFEKQARREEHVVSLKWKFQLCKAYITWSLLHARFKSLREPRYGQFYNQHVVDHP